MGERKYDYQCTQPRLPPNAESPIMSEQDMEKWLNDMDERGWEFVGFGQKHWKSSEPFIQTWWVFRRPYRGG